ncbi:MAG: guanylate kinase, partial [Oscillospiraceae bacterium]|nr:guanylate kinase [Oscillospiraceae bacterium]
LTEEEFRSKIDNGSMLEYAEYNGNFYGTPMEPVMAHLDKGEDVVLEIEVKGAMQVKSKMPEAEMIFILPPSIDTLRQRLIKRGTESLDVIEERVAKAAEEISRAPEYDHVIVNDVLEDAVDDIIKVIDAKEMTAVRCHDMIKKVLDQGDDRT